MKKLSIIIPVYNGEKTIFDTIMSIVPQVEEHAGEVEFLIRDNGSTDRTPVVISEIMKKHAGVIKLDRREDVIQSDLNYRESILMSEGEYFVTIGDDDLIMPGYIDFVLKKLDEYPDIGLLYVNRITVTREYTQGFVREKKYNSKFETLYNTPKEFLSEHILGPDFMSVNVVKRECYNKGLKNFSVDYHGYVWYSVILFGINGYKCLYTQNPIILQRFPVVRAWDDKKTLYSLYGKTKLFSDLDFLYPGIRAVWEGKRRSVAFQNLYSVSLNRSLYKKYRNVIKPYLRKDERVIFDFLLFCKGCEYPYKFFLFFNKIYYMIKKSF